MSINWYTEGAKSNPSAGDLLADTGALANAGLNIFQMTLSASQTAAVTVQHRNAANDGSISEHVLISGNPGSNQFMWYPVMTDVGERFRVISAATQTTNVQVSLNQQ